MTYYKKRILFFSFLLFAVSFHAHAQVGFTPDYSDIVEVDIDLDAELEAALEEDLVRETEGLALDTSLLETGPDGEIEAPKANPFAQHFFAPTEIKKNYSVSNLHGFSVLTTPMRKSGAAYAVITDFKERDVKTKLLPGMKSLEDIDAYFKENLATAMYEGVEIRKIAIPRIDGSEQEIFWVGDKSFDDVVSAKSEIDQVKQDITAAGGNFEELVYDTESYIEIEGQYISQFDQERQDANFRKEENLILKYADQLNIGEQIFGPFQGEPSGEPIMWQSFGETTWRRTNFATNKFESQVGFWTNRVVFKGIRFPLNTVDFFLENTTALDATTVDFQSRSDFGVGLEWRPFARNHWVENFRPFGDIPILRFMRSYRFYTMYQDRKNVKDEVPGVPDHNFIWGISIFYEFGVTPPPLQQQAPRDFWEYLEEYMWGEYFGDYRVESTNFNGLTGKNFDGVIANSSLILGWKMPGIPLPDNPINDKLIFMPYFRFNHVNNDKFSFDFQNRFYTSVGVRWMPFSNWRWKENEWLSNIKIWAEWFAIGKLQHQKEDGEVPYAVRNDLRFGISFASRRF